MITVIRSTTNVRPAKTDKAEIMTTPTPGIVRVNPVACAALGFKIGSYVDVVDGGEAGKPAWYITEGQAPSKDGKIGAKGAKLGSANNKSGSALQFSSANTYNVLGGNDEKNEVWSVNTMADVDANGKKYYAITHDRSENKMERTESTDKDKTAKVVPTPAAKTNGIPANAPKKATA